MRFRRKGDIKELKLWAETILMICLCSVLLAGCMYLYSEGALPQLGSIFKW